jgi:hypothetical protein
MEDEKSEERARVTFGTSNSVKLQEGEGASTDYGTLPESKSKGWKKLNYAMDATMAFKESNRTVKETLELYWAPITLFGETWGTIGSILVPLVAVQFVIIDHPYGFGCNCDVSYPELWSFSRWVCDITYPIVLMFPALSIYISVMLVSWRFTYQRLFNELLVNRIVLHFDDNTLKRAKVLAVVVLVLLYICVAIHFFMKMKDGFLEGDPRKKIMGSTLRDIINDPMSVFEPQNKNLFVWLASIVTSYVTPSILAIVFSMDAGDIEMHLIPLSQLFEHSPGTAVEHLQQSILLPEAVAQEIVEGNDWSECLTPEETCDKLRNEALSFGSVYQLGGRGRSQQDEEDEEEQQQQEEEDDEQEKGTRKTKASGMKKRATAVLEKLRPEGIMALISDRWWPLYVILKPNPEEKVIPSFGLLWVVHCALMIIVMVFLLVIRIHGLYMRFQEEDVKVYALNEWSSRLWWYIFFALPFTLVVFLTNIALAIHAVVIVKEAAEIALKQVGRLAHHAKHVGDSVAKTMTKSAVSKMPSSSHGDSQADGADDAGEPASSSGAA